MAIRLSSMLWRSQSFLRCAIRGCSQTAAEPKISSSHGIAVKRKLGQPSSHTHPFLMKEGEVTPGLTKQKYSARRNAVMATVCASQMISDEKPMGDTWGQEREKQEHVVIVLGGEIAYMSEDIPYPFHQNNNFRYLSGFLEPNSCLIMETLPGRPHPEHKSTLLVPKRDPVKEMWNGSRSGIDGSLDLTGVHHTEEIEKLPDILSNFLSEKYTVWYDFDSKVNYNLHMEHLRPFLSEAYHRKMT
uniref:Aminopeptidase P N-terminal domain-containing protein n=1 Tax=Ciona savignyi TaxID=51511 RepID=H2ZQA5_CIOSA